MPPPRCILAISHSKMLGEPGPGTDHRCRFLRPGAPIPTVTAFPDQNRFLKDVASLVAEFAAQLDVILE
jgi:hypothetical protein